jgi:predicted RND superfamily exporter protein
MKNLYNFGLLTAFTITMALVSDYFIAPALMVVVNRKKENEFSGGS